MLVDELPELLRVTGKLEIRDAAGELTVVDTHYLTFERTVLDHVELALVDKAPPRQQSGAFSSLLASSFEEPKPAGFAAEVSIKQTT